MPHPWIPNSSESVRRKMLEKIGVNDVSELFRDIPIEVRIDRRDWDNLDIGLRKPISEIVAWRIINEKLSRNRVYQPLIFLGGGVYPHATPSVVKYIVTRGEFLTAYTPYQAEISQGLMQALFEYQSLIAELLDMDVVNASMYDWGSALAEAFLMSLRVKKGRRKIVLPKTINPFHREVVETYVKPHSIEITTVNYDPETGLIDIEDLKKKVDRETAAVYVQNPNFFGLIEENAKEIGDIAHDSGALFIVGSDLSSLGLLAPPGELGADIAVGEGQHLGLDLSYGGPYLGVFATKFDMELVKQMPGRLIGLTTDNEGNRAFAMILQAREQHIKREKATSNICTNEALSAIAVAIYLSLLGKRGIIELSRNIYYRSHYAYKLFKENGFNVDLFKSDFFKEFPVNFDNVGIKYIDIHEKLLEMGIHGGLYIKPWFVELGETALFAFTEIHSADDIEKLVFSIKEIVEKRV
uniref:Probable glycine dehydrogenase (decarboxylating) subunit 1 n=1 Tax=Staphylothermus marinus TaxID=2280 RepID=A0A7C4NUH6_STAMA